MSEPLPSRLARVRYRLRTFGTLALLEPDDSIPADRGPQRRLALLAVLAAAGERGRSRDELFLLFWPEATQARARHSLEQLLYSVRTSLGRDVFAGVNPVRLNSESLTSDVEEFNEAVSRGDHAAAVECYQGPFLEGFYLSDAPEFEQWTATERAQLERRYAQSLEHLAETADAASDHASAVRWWRTLAATDPVSSRNAAGLIRALMAAGDHAAALQHAERHEGEVMRALGTSAGPAVTDLIVALRDTSRVKPVMAAPAQASAPASVVRDMQLAPEPGAAPGAPRLPTEVAHRAGSPRAMRYAVGAVVVVLAVVIAAWLRALPRTDTATVPTERSIAVLPLANLGRNPQDAAIVNGISEELMAALSRIENLRVIARTSAFAFRDSDIGVRRIADSLGVTHVLEGSVQRDAQLLRVHVRLIEAKGGSTLWSDTYERTASDIFKVQSEIASRVARELALRMSERTLVRIKRGSTSSIAAYELYLRGNDPSMTRSDSAARAGLEYFRQAIALDSTYAAAYAGLARMHLRARAGSEETARSRDARIQAAEHAARRAITLDDSLGEAHASLSLVMRNQYRLEEAELELKRAIALDPTNARFREWMVQLFIFTERPADALAEARQALRLDPLSPTANAEVANALLANDRCDEALVYLERLESLRPPLQRAASVSAQCHALKAQWPEAIADAHRLSSNSATRGQAVLGNVLARSGRSDEAREILAALIARSQRTGGNSFDVATVYAGLGERDRAFEWLNKSVDDRSLAFDHMQSVLRDMRTDPRFDAIRQRLGYQKR